MKRRLQLLAGFSFYSAINKIIWGVVFLLPQATFASAISYKYMAQIADERAWGLSLFAFGILHINAIFSRNLYFRIAMQTISIAVWLFIATMFALANPLGTGMWVYSAQAICDFIAVIYILKYDREHYE